MHKAIRYIGSKQKLLPFLEENLFIHLKAGDTFFDGFVGSGIVSQYVQHKYDNLTIYGGDISTYSGILFNILNIKSLFSSHEEILNLIEEFETLPLIEGVIFHEFSHTGTPTSYHESRNFYHELSGKSIDTFRGFIKNKLSQRVITQEQSKILLYFLVTYACRAANTTSVFGAFLKSPAKYTPLNKVFIQKILNDLDTVKHQSNNAKFMQGNIIDNLKSIEKCNVIYLDPPYSARKYESNYHILDFIADLKFCAKQLKPGSKTGQPVFMKSNPFGSKKDTIGIFEDMIKEGVNQSDLLAISYNTDGLIKELWMKDFCQKNNYRLETKKLSYKRFKSKIETTNNNNLEEILWLIKK